MTLFEDGLGLFVIPFKNDDVAFCIHILILF